MRPTRIIGILLAVFAALLVATAVILYAAVRSSWIEGVVARQLEGWLGEPVIIGQLGVGYLPVPWIEARQVSVGSDAAGGEPLLSLEGVRAEVPWSTVLRRSDRVQRLAIDKPALSATIDAAGHDNYSALIERLTSDDTAPAAAWWIGELGVEGGSVHYRDARDGTDILLSGIGVAASEVAPGATFEADLRLAVQQGDTILHLGLAGPLTLDLDRRRYRLAPARWRGWIGAPQLELGGIDWTATVEDMSLDLGAGTVIVQSLQASLPGLSVAGDAVVLGLNGEPTARFDLVSSSFSPRSLLPRFGVAVPATTDPEVLAQAQATLRGTADAARVSIDSFEASLDQSTLTGSAAWPLAAGPARLRLAIDRLDLDRYLPPPAGPAPDTPQETLESLAAALGELDLDAEVSIGEARVSGARMRNLRIVVEPNASTLPSAQ